MFIYLQKSALDALIRARMKVYGEIKTGDKFPHILVKVK